LKAEEYTGKNSEIPKLDKHGKILGKILENYWKFSWRTNIGKRDTLTNIGKSCNHLPRLEVHFD